MGKSTAYERESDLRPYTLNTLRTSFESAVRSSLDLFSLTQARYPKAWLPELPNIYVPICIEFCLHARRVNEISRIDKRQVGEIINHRLSYLDKTQYSIDTNYASALNRIIHSRYVSLCYAKVDVEIGNEIDQMVVAIEAESDRKERSLVDLAGLVMLFRKEIAPRVLAELKKLAQTNLNRESA